MPIDQCLTQRLSEKLPITVNGNQYRDCQLGNVQRVRDLGRLGPKYNVSDKCFLSWSGSYTEKDIEIS